MSQDFYEEVTDHLDRRRSNRYRKCKLYTDRETGDPVLGTREIQDIGSLNTDIVHTVTVGESLRLDILAQKYYNNPLLWWVIAQANDIYDPIQGVPAGTKLRIPSMEVLYSEGGVLA